MDYWLFQGNPKYYRILDAIKDLDEMPWLVSRYGKNMKIGDGVLVWMAGADAGIYAIAQITSLPQILTEIPDRQYWIDPQRINNKNQVMIRFQRKLIEQPLKRHELKDDSILKNLLVLRAPNSTNFKVKTEEWQRVQQLRA